MVRRRTIKALPPPRRGESRDIYKWDDAVAEARKHTDNPDLWVLAAEAVPVVKINALRLYTSPPFVTSEGRIEVRTRDSFINTKDGKRYGDCYLRWTPKQRESDDTTAGIN